VGGKVIRALRFARTIFRPVADTGTASGIIKYIEKIQHLSKTHLLSLIKSKWQQILFWQNADISMWGAVDEVVHSSSHGMQIASTLAAQLQLSNSESAEVFLEKLLFEDPGSGIALQDCEKHLMY